MTAPALKATVNVDFAHSWRAEVLVGRPLIAPARQFVYPQRVEGEEDALERGALELMVHPARGGAFLATCALGFADPAAPTGVWSCPHEDRLCAVAGGYAYVIDTNSPERFDWVAYRPVLEVRALAEHGLLLFVGHQSLAAWGREGQVWQTARLSWEGVEITAVDGDVLRGKGWDLMTDKDVEFAVDLRTGERV